MTDRGEGDLDDDHGVDPRVGAAEPHVASPHVQERRQGRTAALSSDKKHAEAPLPSLEIVDDLDLEEIEQEPDGGVGADSRALVGRWRAAAAEEGKDELGKVRSRL